MSHHFDTPTGREDPRINVNDFYLFAGRPGTTVMAMTVNPEADPVKYPLFREEAIYTFRFDTDGDGREDVSFKVRFGEATHASNGRHEQAFDVYRAIGEASGRGLDGDLVASASTSQIASGADGVMVYAGWVQDVFAGNAAGLGDFGAAVARGEYRPEAFSNRENFFAGRNVAAIVLEVPNELIGADKVHGWAAVSLFGHAPEQQVARWGLPLITHLFLNDDETRESFNRTPPSGDNKAFLEQIAGAIKVTTSLAGSAADPEAYAQRVLDRFGHLNLPYTVGSPASFDFVGFNGRKPQDDVMDVMLSLLANSPINDGATIELARIADDFPYFTSADHHRG
ncbi:DUF4331 family protein [Micromonospora chokoriensis]